MLDSYFFIPGNKSKYLNKIESIKSDYFVIDLEDAVPLQSKLEALNLVLSTEPDNTHFVRIPFFENCYSNDQIISIVKHYKGRIVVPKVKELSDIRRIKGLVPNLDLIMIILVENPLCILNICDILNTFLGQIHAISLGNHDFCSVTGIKNSSENLIQYKRQLILYSKAFDVDYIDGVDLNLLEFDQFKSDCRLAFEIGSNGKFLIHPAQYEVFKDIQYFSDSEYEELKKVYDQIKDIPDDEIQVYTINGKVYEKPHINRIKLIMKNSTIN